MSLKLEKGRLPLSDLYDFSTLLPALSQPFASGVFGRVPFHCSTHAPEIKLEGGSDHLKAMSASDRLMRCINMGIWPGAQASIQCALG